MTKVVGNAAQVGKHSA